MNGSGANRGDMSPPSFKKEGGSGTLLLKNSNVHRPSSANTSIVLELLFIFMCFTYICLRCGSQMFLLAPLANLSPNFKMVAPPLSEPRSSKKFISPMSPPTTHLLIYYFRLKKVKAHLVPIPTSGMP